MLDNYRDRVESLARERKGEPIYNASLDHAAIIVEKMFVHGRKHVRILTGNLNARVYGRKEVVEQARLFLADPARQVEILLEESDPEGIVGHPFFDEFWAKPGYENLKVRVVPDVFKKEYKYHFLVMDDDSYRFEEDKNTPTAIAAFGEPKGAQHISKIFRMLWSIGSDLPPIAADRKPLLASA